jgi:hypothetical protein
VKFALETYVDRSILPTAPLHFGHEQFVPLDGWGVLANDKYGCCVWSGSAHLAMMWCAEVGTQTNFTDEAVLSDYAAATGFNPADPSTDQGTDMEQAAAYWRRTGIVDATGKRHQIGAYLAIQVGNLDDLRLASWLFGGVGVGIAFPSSAFDQFRDHRGWSVKRGSRIEGYHYIPVVAHRSHFEVVSWGRLIKVTDAFLKEAVAYVSPERLRDGKSLEGFDVDTLNRDLQALGR